MLDRIDYDLDHNFKHHPPTDDQIPDYTAIRAAGKDFATAVLGLCPNCEERGKALDLIEAAVMWSNAAIARNKKREVTIEVSTTIGHVEIKCCRDVTAAEIVEKLAAAENADPQGLSLVIDDEHIHDQDRPLLHLTPGDPNVRIRLGIKRRRAGDVQIRIIGPLGDFDLVVDRSASTNLIIGQAIEAGHISGGDRYDITVDAEPLDGGDCFLMRPGITERIAAGDMPEIVIHATGSGV